LNTDPYCLKFGPYCRDTETRWCASCLWNYGNYRFTPPAWTAELDYIQ